MTIALTDTDDDQGFSRCVLANGATGTLEGFYPIQS